MSLDQIDAIGVTKPLKFFDKDIHNIYKMLMLWLVFMGMSLLVLYFFKQTTSHLYLVMLKETIVIRRELETEIDAHGNLTIN